MSNIITINRVSKSFRRRKVLDQVSFTVPKGVVFALLGENGAGKSTLIRSMLGFHKVDEGSIQVCGYDPVKNPLELRRAVGYVSDAPALYEWMTVSQVGWYAAGFYGEGFLSSFADLINAFQVPGGTKVRELSKGMRAKVALSLAMAFDPELLMLDEPTSGLDPAVRRSFLESMIDRAAAGQTVFLSSHQVHEVERVADWVAIVHQGKLRVVEELESLKSRCRIIQFAMKDVLLSLPTELDSLPLLTSSQQGRVRHFTVECLPEAVEQALRDDPNLFDLKIIRPNLEELYLAYTTPSGAIATSLAAMPGNDASEKSYHQRKTLDTETEVA